MFDNREGRHGRHGGEGAYARGRANNFGPRGGWEQWGERLEQRFAEVFGEKGGHGGGGGRRRMFDGSELRLVLLKMIADAPRHGYELIKAIEEMTGGAYAPSPGVVYPTLTLLDEMGLIGERQAEGAKKQFAITDAGTAHLEENREAADALIARLTELGDRRERTDGAPIRRAMGNLRQVLQHRLGRDEVSAETLHEVAAIIDAAAQQIERLK